MPIWVLYLYFMESYSRKLYIIAFHMLSVMNNMYILGKESVSLSQEGYNPTLNSKSLGNEERI